MYEPLKRKNENSSKACICIGVSVLFTIAFFAIVSSIVFSNSCPKTTFKGANSRVGETNFIISVENNTISFNATMRLHMRENTRRRSVSNCDYDLQSKLNNSCNNMSSDGFSSCQMESLKEYLENYVANNLINEFNSSSRNDTTFNGVKSVNVEIDLFNLKLHSVDSKAKITLLYERIVSNNETTKSGIEEKTIMGKLVDSFDRCSKHVQVSNIRIGEGAYIAYNQYKLVDGLVGEWQLIKSENFDQVLEQLGLNYFSRRIAVSQTATCKAEYDENLNRWTMTITMPIKTVKKEFEIGVEFDDVTPDGRQVRSKYVVEKNKIVQTERDYSGNIQSVITQQIISDNEHWELIEAGNIVCKRIFHRIK